VTALFRCLCLLLLIAGGAARASDPVASTVTTPRTILALVDLREEKTIRLSRIHGMVEMPLNHLGLLVVYWDVADGLPDLERYPDLRGVVTWFAGEPFDDVGAYIAWAGRAMDRGLRFAVLGQPGVRRSTGGKPAPLALTNRFFAKFGLRDDDGYSDLTYKSRPATTDPMVGYERPLIGVLPGYPLYRKLDARFTSHLVMRRGDDAATDSHLVVTGPTGGLATDGYGRYYDPEINRRQWIIDPFAFFRAAFATDDLPKPDVATLSGRRIYFSHIDGDGWRNVTEAAPYAKDKLLSADVVRKAAVEPFPDLPVSVAPIVGDLDPSWKGTPESLAAAARLFALPQVEPASHTWTHPFQWAFFKDYDPQKEAMFQTGEGGPKRSALDRMLGRTGVYDAAETGGEGVDIGRYAVPRAYLQKPFNLDQEIGGALDYFTHLAPPGKTARLVQWSGDTSPFEAAVAAARKAGGHNMNGGDARFDADYPSITTVPPIGLPVGAERQIYSAGSNENTYTDLWTNRFYGFQNLIHTVRNTDSPIRLKPFNIYYHMYSGQKAASLNALRRNLTAARAAELAPVAASTYTLIAEGFYNTRFEPLGERWWRVRDRGALNTLRFDRASFAAVDFSRSTGVLGQRHSQGSLYVALDPTVATPVVALVEGERGDVPPPAPVPYLIEGRWAFSGLRTDGEGFTVTASGYGDGAMTWRLPLTGRYTVRAERDGRLLWSSEAQTDDQNRLSVAIAVSAVQSVTLRVQRLAR
jgi:polysaccharide biosynthesis protein PelA